MYTAEKAGPKTARKWLKATVSAWIYRTGLLRLGRGFWRSSLTVVNYHRIDDVRRPGLDSFKPNISAHPDDFDRQLEYLKKWFHVIEAGRLVAWLNGTEDLPAHAALITFDDGYLDNYIHAYPVLRQHNLPALIFLTAAHIGTDQPFYWDMTAYCFRHTRQSRVRFPDGNEAGWENEQQRDQVCKDLVEALKELPEKENQDFVQALPDKLGVSFPNGYFRKLMLTWDQVREMNKGGVEFGGHTLNHPILTRIPPEHAREEIGGSKRQIEQQLGSPVSHFAYPNGMESDLNGEIEAAVREAGYKAAYTLQSGPALLREVKQNPFAIRRIFISHKHSMADFAAMLSPLNRLVR